MKPKQGHPPKPKPARIDHLFHDQHEAGLPCYLHHGEDDIVRLEDAYGR